MAQTRNYVPVYQQLTDFYKGKILCQDIKPGGRIDSINKIIERHSVSRETAKLVHAKLIEEGVAVAIQGKGTFVPTQTKIRKRWGVVVPFYSSNIEQLIEELTEVAILKKRKLEYFLHYNNPDEEIRLTSMLVHMGYEGIIVVPNYDERQTADYYKRLLAGNSKVVLADNTMAGSFFSYVIQSYDLGVKRAFDYFRKSKNGNFLLLGNEIWRGQNLVFELMESTFSTLIQTELKDRELFVRLGMKGIDAGFFEEKDIQSVLVRQDVDAVKLIGRLKQWGIKVPEEVSVVSYGNTELTRFFDPPITAIECNYKEMADRISDFVLGEEKRGNLQLVISPEIIKRNT